MRESQEENPIKSKLPSHEDDNLRRLGFEMVTMPHPTEGDIKIGLGVPLCEEDEIKAHPNRLAYKLKLLKGLIGMPYGPVVCIIDRLVLTEQGGLGKGKVIQNAPVMMGHSYSKESFQADEKLVFGPGMGVRAAVEAYEEYAKQNDLPPLAAILTCQAAGGSTHARMFSKKGVRQLLDRDSGSQEWTALGITEELSPTAAYPIGGALQVNYGFVNLGGKSHLSVNINGGRFENF